MCLTKATSCWWWQSCRAWPRKEIKLELNGDVLALSTTGARKYAKEVLLPAAATEDEMSFTYNNGVLEVHLRKAG